MTACQLHMRRWGGSEDAGVWGVTGGCFELDLLSWEGRKEGRKGKERKGVGREMGWADGQAVKERGESEEERE